ncbi:MAG TPA: nucleotidyl transferase AbiEii/AbiGii toxin family protein [Salinivirgaceae bacterium]|nr:nucleotidyl transferase AbiEii/AbiGii toxin family protein [Salinivirgaceae bacterium]HQA75582.1 nucleotidyl transferase AbiEii/AbiGii toxin family protein [Salinivirgaceae bacterium]
MNNSYHQQVSLLLKIIPALSGLDDFAIHGGTAINLYLLDLPRYSIDIDVTYIPIMPREESFAAIDNNLTLLKEKIRTIIPDVIVSRKTNKLYCSQKGVMVKIEVSGTKRGVIEPCEMKILCKRAQNEFETSNNAKIVSFSQLYGGKITAALDRQHPRDLFDVKLMFNFVNNFEQVKKGFFYCLLGGDRPIVETLSPNRIDQQETMIKQFSGMTNIPFSYDDYNETREKLIDFINSNLTEQDKNFLLSFEEGQKLSKFIEYQEYLQFPSVQWKLQNINKLKELNPNKLKQNIKKLEKLLFSGK